MDYYKKMHQEAEAEILQTQKVNRKYAAQDNSTKEKNPSAASNDYESNSKHSNAQKKLSNSQNNRSLYKNGISWYTSPEQWLQNIFSRSKATDPFSSANFHNTIDLMHPNTASSSNEQPSSIANQVKKEENLFHHNTPASSENHPDDYFQAVNDLTSRILSLDPQSRPSPSEMDFMTGAMGDQSFFASVNENVKRFLYPNSPKSNDNLVYFSKANSDDGIPSNSSIPSAVPEETGLLQKAAAKNHLQNSSPSVAQLEAMVAYAEKTPNEPHYSDDVGPDAQTADILKWVLTDEQKKRITDAKEAISSLLTKEQKQSIATSEELTNTLVSVDKEVQLRLGALSDKILADLTPDQKHAILFLGSALFENEVPLGQRERIWSVLHSSDGKITARDLIHLGVFKEEQLKKAEEIAFLLEREYVITSFGENIQYFQAKNDAERFAQLTGLLTTSYADLVSELFSGPSTPTFGNGKLDRLEQTGYAGPSVVHGSSVATNSNLEESLTDSSYLDEILEQKQKQIKINKENGARCERTLFRQFRDRYFNAETQITLKTKSGIKTRVDAIGLDENGNIVIAEFKSSRAARLTKNQRIAFPEIEESGAVVVGKGKGIFSGGTQIKPGTKVQIIRLN